MALGATRDIIRSPGAGGLSWDGIAKLQLDGVDKWLTALPASGGTTEGFYSNMVIAAANPTAGSNASGAPYTPTTASTTAVYDTTLRRFYLANSTGAISGMRMQIEGGHPSGPLGGDRPDFDLDGGQAGSLPPLGINTLVMEVSATFTASRASSSTSNGIGLSGIGSFATAAFVATEPFIAFYRRTTGGWTLKTSDATTISETSESSDTDDSNNHIFRIEWQDGATPAARLYVDGTLKVTKTTNLPALTAATGIDCMISEADTGSASDTIRTYAMIQYWKVS